MSDIPDDVMQEAKRIDSGLDYSIEDNEWHQNIIEGIAKAILTERERAFSIAQKWASDDSQHGEVRLVAAYIAKDIRTGRQL